VPRRLRIASGGIVYHVLNRAAGRARIFGRRGDYEAFERTLAEARARVPVPVLAYCLMPNHWHLLLWPAADGQLSAFVRWLTVTHTQRWHAAHGTAGTGPLYQGRFKSFPVERDRHVLVAGRYVERNALRAGLVGRAQEWRWSSLWHRARGAVPPWLAPAADWPVDVPANWVSLVNRPQTPAEEAAMARSIRRGAPLGDEAWQRRTARALGLESTLRPRGRPRIRPAARAGHGEERGTNKDSRPL
jgi:putative transposase